MNGKDFQRRSIVLTRLMAQGAGETSKLVQLHGTGAWMMLVLKPSLSHSAKNLVSHHRGCTHGLLDASLCGCG